MPDRLVAVGAKAGSVERREWPRLALLEDDPDAGHPVRLLAEDEVAEHVARAVGFRAFVCFEEGLGQAFQEAFQGCGRLLQDRFYLFKAHRGPSRLLRKNTR